MSRKTLAIVLGAFLAVSPLAAASTSYVFDQSKAQIDFNVKHLMIGTARGKFDKFEGGIQYDPKEPKRSTVQVSIDASSINTDNERRDKHLRSEDFFYVEKNPQLRFVSTAVKAGKKGAMEIQGDLTMRGVTKRVVLHSKVTETSDAAGKHMTFEAKTSVNRMDYGIAWNSTNKSGALVLDNKVNIEIKGEAAPAPAAASKN